MEHSPFQVQLRRRDSQGYIGVFLCGSTPAAFTATTAGKDTLFFWIATLHSCNIVLFQISSLKLSAPIRCLPIKFCSPRPMAKSWGRQRSASMFLIKVLTSLMRPRIFHLWETCIHFQFYLTKTRFRLHTLVITSKWFLWFFITPFCLFGRIIMFVIRKHGEYET